MSKSSALTRCPDCGSHMNPIRLLDSGRPGEPHRELGYASGESPRALFTARYLLEGVVRARLCRLCGRIVLHAAPGDRP